MKISEESFSNLEITKSHEYEGGREVNEVLSVHAFQDGASFTISQEAIDGGSHTVMRDMEIRINAEQVRFLAAYLGVFLK